MKILMLGWELPPHNSGGLGVACYHLAKALSEHGASIDFVLPHQLPDNQIGFMRLHSATNRPAAQLPGAYGGSCQACVKPEACPHGDFTSLRSLQAVYVGFVEEHVSKQKPSVIHAHDWLTLEAGVRAKQISGAPLIAHVHATEFDRAGSEFGNPLIHDIERHGLLMADRIIAVSQATKQLIVRRYHIPADKIEVIHNSAAPLPARTAGEQLRYTYLKAMQHEGHLVVTTIGRLTRQKGLHFFLRAAAAAHSRFDRFIFVIAGDGDQRDELIQLSAELGIADKVIFTGFIRGQAWRDIYSLSDVFVMSSVSEPFGLTALEAAQHGTAISLTRQSGVGEVLSNVLRYDYWDDERLADQLINLATSTSLRHELADNVATECSHMSWHKTAERFVHQYARLQGAAA